MNIEKLVISAITAFTLGSCAQMYDVLTDRWLPGAWHTPQGYVAIGCADELFYEDALREARIDAENQLRKKVKDAGKADELLRQARITDRDFNEDGEYCIKLEMPAYTGDER